MLFSDICLETTLWLLIRQHLLVQPNIKLEETAVIQYSSDRPPNANLFKNKGDKRDLTRPSYCTSASLSKEHMLRLQEDNPPI